MEDAKIIDPIHFVNKEEIVEKEKKSEEKADLVLDCKYGKLYLNLKKIPIIQDLF